MKLTSTLLIAIVCTVGLIARQALATTAPVQEMEGESPIIAAMEQVHDGERAMKKAFKGDAPDYVMALEAVVAMQQGTAKAKLLSPPMLESIDESKRPGFMKGYRMKLIAMGRDLLNLEELLLEEKLEEAKAMFKQVRGHEKEGHNTYTE
jgi:hypothetical protein